MVEQLDWGPPSNPWFETESGMVEFVVFQSKIETIGRWLEYMGEALPSFLERERESFRRAVSFDPDGQDGHEEELLWAEDVMPMLSFGSLLPVCFAAMEQLITGLVELREVQGTPPFISFSGGHGAPAIERMRLYLEREAKWTLHWRPGERRQFELLLSLRNRVAHSLGDGVSSETLRELTTMMEWPGGKVRWEPRLVEAALYAVGELAQVLEQGMLDAERRTQ